MSPTDDTRKRESLLTRTGHWLRRWIGDEGTPLEDRLFRMILVGGGVASLAAVGINLIVDATRQQLWLCAAFASFCWSVLVASRWTGSSRPLRPVLVVGSSVLMIVGWTTNDGSQGSIGAWFFLVLIYTVLSSSGWNEWFVNLVPVLAMLASLLLEHFRPELIVPYASPEQRFLDVALSSAVVFVVAWLLTTLVTAEHRRERRRSRRRGEQLEQALAEIRVLKHQLSICSHCKKIRDTDGEWQPLESYISAHTDTRFSHGVCDQCRELHYGEFLAEPIDED